MRLKFAFSDGTSPVDIKADTIQATPMELLVSATGDLQSQKDSLEMYVLTLDYMFRGVANLVSTKVNSVLVEKSWFGKIKKHDYHVVWEAISDKSLVVLYSLSQDSITESLYVADGIKVHGEESVTPIWSKKLFKRSTQLARDNIISAIAIATATLTDYKLVWGYNGKNAPAILNANGESLLPEDVDDDESYILLKLLLLLSNKGAHMGVYMVDCRGFSDKVLTAFSEIARAYHGDAFIFFYNVPQGCKVDRIPVVLPNIC